MLPMKHRLPILISLLVALAGVPRADGAEPASPAALAWPPITQTAKPWAYWWWMASAVDTNNLAKELARYRDAGLGGVHVIPIYGAKGWESNAIPYLSPKWMEMLAFTVAEAGRLGLGVDMTTGSGWCFGGPRVTDAEANASVVWQTHTLPAGTNLTLKLDPKTTQALIVFPEGQPPQRLTGQIAPDGTSFTFATPSVPSVLYVVSQRPSGQRVKRAAPGGEGHMLNLASPAAMTNYLRGFDEAFASYPGPWPRAQYHDSYEYRTDWAPEFFAEFEQRRGYRLQDELPALFANTSSRFTNHVSPALDPDRIARVKCDYRETLSDIMVESTLPQWAGWAHRHGCLTRNEAHGSPGNWLDLYAAADIPETEMFYKDRNKLISKFASSAAHVTGRNLVACETGTWLAEHFTETLADMKWLLDDLFLSGVNHVLYHGTCYSPDEAPWPGWLFYASYQMNPRNPVWRDVPVLNAYAARCQAVLQDGQPDNDLLLYWPLHDFWSSTNGLARNMTVHARGWFEGQPIGHAADWLWRKGFQFDYVSDRQLARARTRGDGVEVSGGSYRAVLVPACRAMPVATLENLLRLAGAGATVIFEGALPTSAAGMAGLRQGRAQFAALVDRVRLSGQPGAHFRVATLGAGRVLVGELEPALAAAGAPRERLFDQEGLMCIRRRAAAGRVYFIANRGSQSVRDWVPLATPARSVAILDPMTGDAGWAASRTGANGQTEVHLDLPAGASTILRAFDAAAASEPASASWQVNGAPAPLAGAWQVEFLAGGPELPAPFRADQLVSWAKLGDTNAQRFAGTARYTLRFDRPAGEAAAWQLDLGKVCQSARVRLNGSDLGTLLTPPFRVIVRAANLKPADNLLEVEVTSTAANRIRDLDRRGVKWKNFHDINFVNLAYKPFDASEWALADAGLLGPVSLAPLAPLRLTP